MRCTVMFPFRVRVSSFNGSHCIDELLWSLFNSVANVLQPFCCNSPVSASTSSYSFALSGLESSCVVDVVDVMSCFVSPDRISNIELLFAFPVNPSFTLKTISKSD